MACWLHSCLISVNRASKTYSFSTQRIFQLMWMCSSWFIVFIRALLPSIKRNVVPKHLKMHKQWTDQRCETLLVWQQFSVLILNLFIVKTITMQTPYLMNMFPIHVLFRYKRCNSSLSPHLSVISVSYVLTTFSNAQLIVPDESPYMPRMSNLSALARSWRQD